MIQTLNSVCQRRLVTLLTAEMGAANEVGSKVATTRMITTKSSTDESRAQLKEDHYDETHLQRRIQIAANPRVCQHDVPTKLSVSGMQPHVPVTLKLQYFDVKGIEFSSIAHYFTDSNGKVNVNQCKSWGGSYEGVFPAGLFSTLEPPSGKYAYKRMTCTNTAKPLKMTLSVHDGYRTKDECTDPANEIELERHIKSPGVKRIEIEEGRVRGVLYVPAGPGPFPAVIDMFGATAVMMEHRSAMLASRGIISLVLPFFGYKDLPKTFKNMDMEYFKDAVDILLSTPSAIPDRCGVVATCQGGAIGLSMGVWLEKVKAVFAINASTCLFGSTMFQDGKPLIEGYNLCSDDLVFDKFYRGRLNGEKMKHTFMQIDNKSTIPLELATPDTQFHIAVGEDCSCCSLDAMKVHVQRLQRSGNTNYQVKVYPGAGHILEPPYGPFIHQSYQQYFPYKSASHTIPEVGSYIAWGGTPQHNCQAQEQLWQDMQKFVRTEVRDKSSWYQSYISSNDQAL